MYRVRNLKQFQHYKHRRPPWVKLYRVILDDKDHATLPDSAWRLALELLLIASGEEDGEFECNAETLSWALRRKIKASDLEKIEEIGFIERADNVLATSGQGDSDMLSQSRDRVETERETETEAPSDEFWERRRSEVAELRESLAPGSKGC